MHLTFRVSKIDNRIGERTMAQENNMAMAKYIISIFRTQPMVVCSWGYSSPIAIKDGLRFRVNGFRHKGWCEVVYNEGMDTFTFRTIGRDGKAIREFEDVYFDNLVSVIDMTVETGRDSEEQYKARVNSWLGKGIA